MSRLVLLGNNQAACFVLETAVELFGVDNVLVVAPPDRDLADWHERLGDVATARGVSVISPDDVNDPTAIDRIIGFDPRLVLSVYYTQIFRPRFLEAVPCPIVNVHPALLPRHRGTAPLVWAIIEGDDLTGVTVHHIERGVDTGRMILQRRLPIHPDDTGFLLHRKAAFLVRASCVDLLTEFAATSTVPHGHQQTGEMSIHRHSDPRVNQIRWTDHPERVRNIVRALAPPLPGAFTTVNGVRLDIHEVQAVETPSRSPAPGYVSVDASGIVSVAAVGGGVRLLRVKVGDRSYEGVQVAAIETHGARMLREGVVAR